MTVLDRFPRRARMVGGPLNGRDAPLPIPDQVPDPPYLCHRAGCCGPWQHYVREADGTYRYIGECATTEHDGSAPHEHRCCCGRDDRASHG